MSGFEIKSVVALPSSRHKTVVKATARILVIWERPARLHHVVISMFKHPSCGAISEGDRLQGWAPLGAVGHRRIADSDSSAPFHSLLPGPPRCEQADSGSYSCSHAFQAIAGCVQSINPSSSHCFLSGIWSQMGKVPSPQAQE